MKNVVFLGGQELKEFRKRNSYTQKEIAYHARVSQAAISMMENNKGVGMNVWSKVVMFMLRQDRDYYENKYGKDMIATQIKCCCW